MSDATTEPQSSQQGIVRDVCLWKRKKPALFILFISTAIWVLLNVYRYNFLTIASWTAMAVVTLLYLWGNLLRVLSKNEPEMSGLNLREEFAVETANSCRQLIEDGIRWMFHVSAEEDWFVFARTVLGLLVLSYIGQAVDFQTFLLIGTVMGLTVPVIWEKNKERIKGWGQSLKARSRRVYEMADDKIIKKMKNKFSTEDKIKKNE